MQPAYIVRGTTPTLIIKFRIVDLSQLEKAVLVIKQKDTAKITITDINRMTVDADNKCILIKLTQSETLELDKNQLAVISYDWLLNDGTRGRSNEVACRIEDPAQEGVMSNE